MIDRYFPHTKDALTTTINDFKSIYKSIKYISLFFTFAYLVYVFVAKVGNFWVNVTLAGITFAYYVFFVFSVKLQSRAMQSTKKVVRRIYHWLRIIVRAASLGFLLYGMASDPKSVTPISIILATITVIIWVLQVIFELVCNLLEVHKDLIVESVVTDWQSEDVQKLKDKVIKAKDTAVSIVNGVTKTANVLDKIFHPFRSRKKLQEKTEEETAVTEYILDDESEEK